MRKITICCLAAALLMIGLGLWRGEADMVLHLSLIHIFIRRSPALDVVLVLYKPGIYLMAKRILGWDDTHSYETSAK